MKKRLVLAAFATALLSTTALSQELPKTHFKVVGGLSTDAAYIGFEKPFWTQTVPELSKNRITADIKPFDEMGLKGPEILRLMSQGVIEFGAATLSYFASDNPINDAVNLAGMAPSVQAERAIIEQFAPVYAKRFLKDNIKTLGFGPNPAQVLFCNAEIKSLADIKGKKVRTSSRTQADFINALEGASVNMAFAEVVPALQTKVIDCAITGSLSGFTAKWYEVSTHLLQLPINWNPIIYAVNLDAWKKLNPGVQTFIETNMKTMVDGIWDGAARQTQEGYDCNTGAPACKAAVKGKMTLVIPTEADTFLLKKITQEAVVPKWAARCSVECVESFNATIGKSLGIVAKK
jgi:TRAP-type C4-dicarboxylate transport system substrate-binding protein